MSKKKDVAIVAVANHSAPTNDAKSMKDSKRKRRDEDAEVELKALKKSKKSKDVEETAIEGTPVADVKKEKKEKKDKKDKKSKKVKSGEDTDEKMDEPVAPDTVETEEKKSKMSKKSKNVKEPADERETAPLEDPESTAEDFIPLDDEAIPDAGATASKKDKKSKKGKKAEVAPETNGVDVLPEETKDKKKSKKEKKKKEKKAVESAPIEISGVNSLTTEVKEKKKSKKDKKEAKSDPTAETNGAAAEESPDAKEEETATGKKDRFIVFVGNLPYTATKAQIETHFAKIPPKEVRMVTDKNTGKHKGIAFIEFDKFDKMETCLKKYHHSIFPDGKNKAGRKINIELSAGGGGNSESRKTKIAAKNDKLAEERIRDREKRDELEAKQKERADKKAARQKKNTKGGDAPAEEKAEVEKKPEDEHKGIHPARLAMMSQRRY